MKNPIINSIPKVALTFVVFASLVLSSCQSKQDVEQYLQNLPQAEWKEGNIEVDFSQPVDHNHPSGKKFTQKVMIHHVGYDHPVVVHLLGYAMHTTKRCELARLLDANQITIEHRYFGDSKPLPIRWKYLDIWQAATDHHKVINALKKLYTGKWITTGVSKGGQAVMFHKRFYPDDVDAGVAYVAPLTFSPDDRRIEDYLDQAGTADCRSRIRRFQEHLLGNRNTYIPLFREFAGEKGYEFSMGIEKAFELTVLEYRITFWQYSQAKCMDIPAADAHPRKKFSHLVKASRPEYFESSFVEANRAFFYQAFTQTGMYSIRSKPFSKYLNDTTPITMAFGLTDSMTTRFDSSAMRDIDNWLKKKGDRMMYIYGEVDPWTAAAFEPSENTSAVKMINPGGNHTTQILTFPDYMRDSIYRVLEDWLDINDIKKTTS
jgi:hypothetical protein